MTHSGSVAYVAVCLSTHCSRCSIRSLIDAIESVMQMSNRLAKLLAGLSPDVAQRIASVVSLGIDISTFGKVSRPKEGAGKYATGKGAVTFPLRFIKVEARSAPSARRK